MGRRPEADVARSELLHIRFTPDEMERVASQAQAVGLKPAEWARGRLLLAKAARDVTPAVVPATKEPKPVAPAPASGDKKRHFHRREVVSEVRVNGMIERTLRCPDDGHTWIDRSAI